MRIYWSLKSIPELAEVPKKDRKKIWRRCFLKALRNWQTLVAGAALGLCAALGNILGEILGYPCIGGAIGGAAGGLICSQVAIKRARPYIREYLEHISEIQK